MADRALAGQRAPTRGLIHTAPPVALSAGREAASTVVRAGDAGRLVVLADAVDPNWEARLDGKPLQRRTAWGWAQAFALPTSGGRLTLSYVQTSRQVSLGVEVLLLVVVAVLSVPNARRRRGLEEYFQDEEDEVQEPQRRRMVTAL